ncbi:CLUMA_CG012297, isoform A [Clunio marinus]|uniref:CLUMA_CG012297, isoform A n=1 Tax=Clunio marinus TaxID=568069 RepID=A0A1J1IFL5_9DIPT|nr:CLUMA_CG012297, isoform A [Clunio marinus]
MSHHEFAGGRSALGKLKRNEISLRDENENPVIKTMRFVFSDRMNCIARVLCVESSIIRDEVLKDEETEMMEIELSFI